MLVLSRARATLQPTCPGVPLGEGSGRLPVPRNISIILNVHVLRRLNVLSKKLEQVIGTESNKGLSSFTQNLVKVSTTVGGSCETEGHGTAWAEENGPGVKPGFGFLLLPLAIGGFRQLT